MRHKTPATYIAAICSFPGGFDVLILIKSASQPCASFEIAGVLGTAAGLAGIPGLSAGVTCAVTGIFAAIVSAAAPAKTWIMRFPFTNPSSSSRLAATRPLQ